jgi:PEP-CTERM motif
MLRQLSVLAAILSAFAPATTAVGQIFTDNLSTGTNWSVVQDADTSVEFGFDYSTKGVPAAPNGSDTIGLKFEVNNFYPEEADGIAAINTNAAYTGQFTFRVDAWINWAPDGGTVGTGTTEFIGAAVGHDGSIPLPLGGSFIYTSDGDAAATDYRFYKDSIQLQSESGQYAAGTLPGARDSANPYYTDAFPSFDIATAVPTQGSSGTQPAGAGGFQWMTLNFEVDTDAIGPSGITTDPGYVRISMRSAHSGNTIEIGTIDNSNGDFFPANLGGSIGLQMYDLFTSVTINPTFSFGLFDNVQVLEGLVPLSPSGIAGDFDLNKVVDGDDFLLWQRDPGIGNLSDWEANYGKVAPLSATLAAVPEPSSLLLGVLASIGLMFRRRCLTE